MGRNANDSMSETTGLLSIIHYPSAHSTDSPTPKAYSSETLPLVSSYEDLRRSVELQLEELNTASKSRKESVFPSSRSLTRCHALWILLGGCLLSLLGVAFFLSHGNSGINGGHGQSTNVRVDPLPFSLLDPVKDLKLASYDRPEETKPPKELFAKNYHHDKSKPHQHVPTNAWYQNLLLLRGEPSNIHRLYSTPYLLDVVGHIPGLRTHRTRVLSSDSVLQLTQNEENGVTLGAAMDMTAGMTNNKKEELPHAYRVLETTKLGLTLQWVRVGKIIITLGSALIFRLLFLTDVLLSLDGHGYGFDDCQGNALHNHGIQRTQCDVPWGDAFAYYPLAFSIGQGCQTRRN